MTNITQFTPGGKRHRTHGNTTEGRRGLPGSQNMHDNLARMNTTDDELRAMEEAWLARYGWLAIAALVGLAIGFPLF